MEVDRGASEKDGRKTKTIRLRGSSEQVALAKRLVDERLSQWTEVFKRKDLIKL